MKIRICIIFLLAIFQSTQVLASPPTAASIRELLKVKHARSALDSMQDKIGGMMKSAVDKELAGRPITPAQRKIIDHMEARMAGVLRQELSWDVMAPMYIEIYKRTFTEEEIKGMIAFYKSKVGQSVAIKMPVVLTNTMKVVRKRLAVMMPQLQRIERDTVVQLKATEHK